MRLEQLASPAGGDRRRATPATPPKWRACHRPDVEVDSHGALDLAARVCLPGNPLCPPPDVTITPSSGTYTTAAQTITIDWCGHAPISSPRILFNGVDVANSFSFVSSTQSGCSSHWTSTGTVTLSAGTNSLSASIDDNIGQTGSSSATYTLNVATISLAPQPTDRVDAASCAAQCFESTLGYSTPAYVSLGVPRSVSLNYRSGQARPVGKVQLDATKPATPVGTRISLQLMSPGGSLVTLLNGENTTYSEPASSGTTRLAAEFDASGLATGRYLYTATVRYLGADSVPQGPAVSVSVGVIVVNESASPYGAGVTIAGVQRLATNPDGTGQIVTDGLGGASYFAGSCPVSSTCSYVSPVGDLSALSRSGSGYVRKYPDGTAVTFDANGNHVQTADRFGAATSYAYGWNADYGRYALQSITDPAQLVTAVQYRDINYVYNGTFKVGSLGWFTTPGGRVTAIGINPANNLIELLDPDFTYYATATYDDIHRLTHFNDRANQGWDFGYYDASTSHVQTITAPAVTTISGTVRPVVSLRESSGAILRYLAMGNGTFSRPVQANTDTRPVVTDPGGHSTFFSVNPWGQPLATTDALGRTTTVTRDADGFPTQIQYPTGAVDVFRYAGHNLVTSWPAGKDSTNYRWSVNGTGVVLLDSIWGQRQAFQKFSYQPNGAIQTATARYSQSDATSFPTQYVNDTLGRPLTVTDPAGHVTRYFYHGRYGNPDSVAMAAGQWTKTIHDVFGRDSVQSALGTTASSTIVYDSVNRVRRVYDGAHPQPFRYYYSAVNLDSISDPMGQTFRRTVNALGWKTAELDVDPTKGSITFNYDVEGQVRSWTNRRGQTINLTYDAAHRLTSRVGATMADYFGYSPDDRSMAAWNAVSVDSVFFAANGWKDSSVTRVASQRFRQQFLPDVAQRLDSMDIAMTSGSIGFAGRKYLYDAVKSTLTNIRVNGVAGAAFDYDGEMFLSGIRYQMPLAQEATRQLLYTSTHQTYGDVLNLNAYGSSYFARYVGYDSLGRIRESASDGAYPDKTFKYTPTDQLLERARFSSTTGPCAYPNPDFGLNCAALFNPSTANETDVYTYDDALNRRGDVNSGRMASGTTWSSSTNLTYTTGDRVTTIAPQGGTSGGQPMLPDPAFAATFARDQDGNVTHRYNTAGTDVQYDWDEQGRLTTVTVPTTGRTATYDYNAFGQLVRRRTNGNVDRHFLWNGDDLLAELDGTATQRIAEYVYWSTDEPMAMVTGPNNIANVDYFLQDQIGNVRTAFRRATNAPIVFGSDYTEWGLLRDTLAVSSPNRLRWKGMIWEGDSTQLYYARNRWYSPQFGGFMSEDPLGPAGGANTYAFADNDPINGSDPTGLSGLFAPLPGLPPGPYQFGYNDGFPHPDFHYPGKGPSVAPPTATSIGPVTYSGPLGLCSAANRMERGSDFCPGGQGVKSAGLLDPIGWLSGGIAAGFEQVLGGAVLEGSSTAVGVQANKAAGDAFRDEIASAFAENGYGVAREVGKKTPFGRRVIDIEVSKNGAVLGGIETKLGSSRYLPWQIAKDAYLTRIGYPVQLVRDATAVKVSGLP